MNRETIIFAIIGIYAIIEDRNAHIINNKLPKVNETKHRPTTSEINIRAQEVHIIILSNKTKISDRTNDSIELNEPKAQRIAFQNESYAFVIILWAYAIIICTLIYLNSIDPNRFVD